MDLRLAAAWQPAKGAPLLQMNGDHNPLQGEGDAVRWGKLRKIAGAMYGSTAPHGRPAVLRCSASNLIVLGTETADVVVFDYQQEFKVKLTPPPRENCRYGSVTALAVSQDETCVAAGYASGYVIVWDLSYPQLPKMMFPPTNSRKSSRPVPANESHLAGSTVCFVFFVGKHRSIVISIDNHGLIFLHQNIRILLGNTIRSRKISGQYKQKTPTTVLAAALIEQPNAPLLIATITPYAFRGISITPPKTHFRFSSALDNVETTTGLAASLAYSSETQKLAYSWGNMLKIMSVNYDGNDYVVTAERMFSGPESFVYVSWFTSTLLVAVTVTQELQFFGPDLTILDTVNVLRKYPLHHDYYSEALREGKTPVVADAFYTAIQVQHENIFVLGRYEFEYGMLVNWADCIVALLNQSKPVNAVLLAYQYYTSEYDLSMIGLEESSRQEMIRKALPDIIVTSMRFCLAHDQEHFAKLLAVSMQAIVVTGVPLLEPIMDMITEDQFRTMYFEFLVTFVLDGSIEKLPPKVFKELVRAKADSQVIQDIILSLDISTLDIDLAFSICDEYKLEEAKIFLQTVALNDFVAPLTGSSSHRFTYLSYVLTGRAFPTERPLANPTAAKSQVYNYIFDTDHGPLETLVEANERAFFTALNEAFEDPALNEEGLLPVSRQTMLNILFDSVKKPYFDVFVARNFPKYQQYLMVTGSRLERVLTNLIESPLPQEETELAILSLLSVYKPSNMSVVLQQLHEEKFYAVLEKLYKRRGDYRRMILVAFEDPSDNVWGLLPEALREDHKAVFPLLVSHLDQMLRRPRDLAVLASQSCSDLHWEVVSSKDEEAKFEYLKEVFDQVADSSQLPPPAICNEYVKLLATRDGDLLLAVLKNTITQAENVSLPFVVDSLIENRRTGALALLLCRLDRKSEAMIYLKNHIRTREPDEDIDGFVKQAVEICHDMSLENPQESQGLWASLVEAQLVAGSDIAPSLRVLVDGPQIVAVNVIAELINDVDGPAAASLIEKSFTAMAIQTIALSAVHGIVQGDSYQNFAKALNERLKGWTVAMSGECEGCGRKVVGIGIDAERVYVAWEAKKRGEDYQQELLVIFQCKHAYHLECLQRLSSTKKCILCFPE